MFSRLKLLHKKKTLCGLEDSTYPWEKDSLIVVAVVNQLTEIIIRHQTKAVSRG